MKRKGMSPKSIDPVTQLVPGEWDRVYIYDFFAFCKEVFLPF
jgi:hypothetical protein